MAWVFTKLAVALDDVDLVEHVIGLSGHLGKDVGFLVVTEETGALDAGHEYEIHLHGAMTGGAVGGSAVFFENPVVIAGDKRVTLLDMALATGYGNLVELHRGQNIVVGLGQVPCLGIAPVTVGTADARHPVNRIIVIDIVVVELGMLNLEGGVLVAFDALIAEADRSGPINTTTTRKA